MSKQLPLKQLRLMQGGLGNAGSRLDARTRRVGRRGIAEARRALEQANPPGALTRRAG